MSVQKVLVVDDEVQMRRVLRAAPGAHGYEVVEAASREEALRRLDSEDGDFVFSTSTCLAWQLPAYPQ